MFTSGVTQGHKHFDLMRRCHDDVSETEMTLCETVMGPPSTGADLAPKLRAALQYPERPAWSQPIYWIDHKKLKPGDEVTIKLIDLPDSSLVPAPAGFPISS